MKWLNVEFHDNDFAGCITDALKRLYAYVKENNDNCHPENRRTIPEVFEVLHAKGRLTSLVERLALIEHMAFDVEFETRGIASPGSDDYHFGRRWKGLEEVKDNGYLRFDLSFHENRKFMRKWNNGESVALNLETGEACSY